MGTLRDGAWATESSVGMTGSTLATTVFFASLITALCSLIGVLTIAPRSSSFWITRVLKVSARVLFSRRVLPASFEGNHMMYKVGDESEQSGVRCLPQWNLRFLVKILTDRFVGAPHSHGADIKPADVEMATTGSTSKGSSKGADKIDESNVGLFDFSRSTPIAWSVFWGDMFHNISDGIVIGSAFLYCSKSFGWTLTGATVAHG